MSTETTATAATCRICGSTDLDTEWEALAGENPGPAMLAIGQWRHAHTGLDSCLKGMRDDTGAVRCLLCLLVVPADAILGDCGALVQIDAPVLRTGYERLCCGYGGDAPVCGDDD